MKRFTGCLARLLAQALKESGISLSMADFAALEKNFDAVLNAKAAMDTPDFLWFARQAKVKGDLTHLVGPRGVMRRPGTDEQTSPIASGLVEGHAEEEYLRSAHGARAGLVDKGLNTAPAGILLRDLVYTLQGIYIVDRDCRTTEGLVASSDQVKHLVGRSWVNRDEGAWTKESDTHVSPGGGIHYYRSPYQCRATTRSGQWGICQKCYGFDPATGQPPEIGLPVGLLAAQAIGERASQLTLRTFHTGGGTKNTLNLGLLRQRLSKPKITTIKDASQWIEELVSLFQDLSDPPQQVHFEIILRGLKDQSALERDFLAHITWSKVEANLLLGAARRAEDTLWGVISRIVSGQLVGTGLHRACRRTNDQ